MSSDTAPRWTSEAIVDAIQASAVDGVAPNPDRVHVSLGTMARRRFGSWTAACAAAGVRAANDVPTNPSCRVEGCAKSPRSRIATYCEMHYMRLRRNGDPTALVQFRDRMLTVHGYVRVRRRDHPTAGSHWPYEHRVILYDAIGPGTHPCHWCGLSVTWERTYPDYLDGLCVDHVDADTTNNDLSNLVPSCFRCNLDRSRRDPCGPVLAGATSVEQREMECVA